MTDFDSDYFFDEKSAYAFVEARLWPDGRRCPHCGVVGRSGPLSGQSTRLGTYKCYACRKPFTVKIGTIFEGSHIPLHIWLRAIFLLSTTRESVSANQLHRILGISVKSALYLLERIGDGSGAELLCLTTAKAAARENPERAVSGEAREESDRGGQSHQPPSISAGAKSSFPEQLMPSRTGDLATTAIRTSTEVLLQPRVPADVSARIRWRHSASRIRLSHSWQGAGQSRQGVAVLPAGVPGVRFMQPVIVRKSPAIIATRRSAPGLFGFVQANEAAQAAGPSPDAEYQGAIPVREGKPSGAAAGAAAEPLPALPRPARSRAPITRPKSARGLLHSDTYLPGGIPIAPAPADIGPGRPQDTGKISYIADAKLLPVLPAGAGRLPIPASPLLDITARDLPGSSSRQVLPADVADPMSEGQTPSPAYAREASDEPDLSLSTDSLHLAPAEIPGIGTAGVYVPAGVIAGEARAPIPEIRSDAAASPPIAPLPLFADAGFAPQSRELPAPPVAAEVISPIASAQQALPVFPYPEVLPSASARDVASLQAPAAETPEHAQFVPKWSVPIATITQLEDFSLVYAQMPIGADGAAGDALAQHPAPLELGREYATATCDSDIALGLTAPAQSLSMSERAAWQQIHADLPLLSQDGPADTAPELVQAPLAVFAWQRPGQQPATGIDIAYHANDNRSAPLSGSPPSPPPRFWARARQRFSSTFGVTPLRQIEVPPPQRHDRAVAVAAQATSQEFAAIPAPGQFATPSAVLFRFAELPATAGVLEEPVMRAGAAILPVLPAPGGGVVLHFPARLTEAREDWAVSNPVAVWRAEGELPASSTDAAPGPGSRPIPQPLALELLDFRPPPAQHDEYALAPALHEGEVLRREFPQAQETAGDSGDEQEELPAYLVPPLPFAAEDAAAPSATPLGAPVAADISLLAESAGAAPEPIADSATGIVAEAPATETLAASTVTSGQEPLADLAAPLPAASDSVKPAHVASPAAPASNDALIAASDSAEFGMLPFAGALPAASDPVTAKLDLPAPVTTSAAAAAAGPILPAEELPEIPAAALAAGSAPRAAAAQQIPAANQSSLAASGDAIPPQSSPKTQRVRQVAIAGAAVLLGLLGVIAQQVLNRVQNGTSGQTAGHRNAQNGGRAQTNASPAPGAQAPPIPVPGGNSATPASPTASSTGGNSASSAAGAGGPGTPPAGGGTPPPQPPAPPVPAPQPAHRATDTGAAKMAPPLSPQQPLLQPTQPAAPSPQIAQVPSVPGPLPQQQRIPLPAPLPPFPPVARPMPEAGRETAPQQQVLLHGLRLVDAANKVLSMGYATPGVTIENIAMLDSQAFRAELARFLGMPVSENLLQTIGTVIANWYRDHDYPFVDVAFPAGQDITNGIIQVVVAESRAGIISARNNRYFSSGLLTSNVRVQPGQRISLSELEADKAWLNQNPFHNVNIVAQPSPTPGYTDLIVDTVQEQFPLRAHLGYDNTGLPVLGRDHWTTGLDVASEYFYDAQLSYQYTSNLPLWRALTGTRSDYEMHSGTIVAPLPWRDKLTVFGVYATAVPNLGPDIGVTGITWQASGRYVLSLPMTTTFNQQLQAGFDFKSSNNNILFGGFQVSDVTSQIAQLSADYAFSLRDALGLTSADATAVVSPGGMSSGNTNDIFGQQQPFAKARYAYARLDATRLTGLPQNAEWVKNLGWFGGASSLTHVVGQWASNVLLPTEQLGLGGLDTVPGYNERTANGSVGVLLNEELLTPAFGILRHFLPNDPGDQAQLSGFFAYGSVRNQKWQAGTENDHDLMSAGLGVRYNLSHYVNFRFVYGWQLRAISGVPVAEEPKGGQLGEFTLTLSYP